MKRIVLSLIFMTLLTSCSSDDDSEIVSENIDYFIEVLKDFNNGDLQSHSTTRYNLIDGKYFSRVNKNNIEGWQDTFQTHFYSNGLLVKEYTNMSADYSYNGQQLIAMQFSSGDEETHYRRFVAVTPLLYHIEILSAAYDDPEAEITGRYIVEFNANDELITASEDLNLDGVMDAPSHFTYQNGDVITATKPNGDVIAFEYSDVIDNYNAIKEKTYGKKSRGLIFIRNFLEVPESLHLFSKHVQSSYLESSQYTVLSNHYFKKVHTVFNFGAYRNESTATFYFK